MQEINDIQLNKFGRKGYMYFWTPKGDNIKHKTLKHLIEQSNLLF